MTSELKIGDLVLAKMKGFTPWPAQIVQPGSGTNTPNSKKSLKKGHHWVYFFGSHNYASIEENNIKRYAEYKDKFISMCNTPVFKKAVSEIEDFISNLEKNPNYQLELPSEQPAKSKDDSEEKFNKLVTPKRTKKAAPVKRQNSDSGSSSKNSFSKRARQSTPRMDENGVADGIGTVGSAILNFPSITDAPESPTVDLNNLSELLKTKNISASKLTFGFIGLGTIGSGIVKNLINSGHRVNLYSRTMKKCDEIKEQADTRKVGLVNTYITPWDVMQNSDIIFSCVTDPRAAKENVVGNCGVAGRDGDILEGKGYVEMTGIDPQTSKDICEIIKNKGGRYLEAQVQGSKSEANEGSLVVLAAGDKSLFFDCQSCFKAMGKTAFFLGDVGYATKTNLILQLMKGVALVGLAEGLALADRCGISSKDVLNIFNLTNLACDYMTNKADLIAKKEFKHVEQAIEHMQKDMKLALDLSDQMKQPLLMTSTANEVYKHARRLGYDGHDASCIYMRTRH
ncbi:nucleosome-destabilizing factor isoform X1 [Leptinotarsa decemlineata]|uniref:nucleosome-destabilizing factor isoform X1 n=1 Tax=Leptinotarsa decemlineata TaxID=7539 RepID=UPI003D307075